jgi:paraquat-inducible protein A
VTTTLISCHECDLLQQEVSVPAGAAARCARCGAVLYRNRPDSLNRALAFGTAAAVLFVLANTFPLVALEVKGELIKTTLFGASRAIYEDGMRTLGALVFVTTIVAPLIQLVALMALLVPLRLGREPHAAAIWFRLMRAVQPWGMAEVLMLGVLVALVKLAHMAEVIPGIALWSLAALVMVLAACVAAFDPRALWAKVDATR